MIENKDTPLFQQLCKQREKEAFSFHVPGHKNGKILSSYAQDLFHPLLQIDSTELNGLDDLHDPQGVIQEAERLTAELYNAKRTFFLVGGSSVGNLSMILASCKRNDTVLVQRNSHKSIMNGCRLAGAHPIFLTPSMDGASGLSTGITLDTVQATLQEYPHAKALILTYPSYFGLVQDINEIIELAHSYDIPVLVDEAHGAHFCLGEPFPKSALELGADIVVQSAHKTLPAMTMASYLHVNQNCRISESRIHHYLQMLQSSSPSYPLMASLDLARGYLASLTKKTIQEIHQDIIEFRKSLDEILQWNVVKEGENFTIDPLKVTVQTNCQASGIELQQKLEAKGIYVELADENNLLFVMPLAPFKKGSEVIKLIKEAVSDIPVTMAPVHNYELKISSYTSLALSYEDMDEARKEKYLFKEAVGKIAAEPIIPYPPGIPFIMEGEYITKDKLEQIKQMIESGVRFQGHTHLEEEGILCFSR